jgi:lysozyme
MLISSEGLAFIQSFEGYHTRLPDGSCKAYRCQIGEGRDDGRWSIGFGCTEGITANTIWTRAQADEAFRKELEPKELAVDKMVTVGLGQNQYDALVSFAYNCGEGALRGSTLLKKLNAGDYDGAAECFGAWVNSNGVKRVPGLVRRRAAEAAMFRRPDDPSTIPDMPQSVEPPSAREEHLAAHDQLKAESPVYSLQRMALKLLGLPASGGVVGLTSISDPQGALAGVTTFARTYGIYAVAGIVVGIIVLEALQYLKRQALIGSAS